jgi:predicted acetyltransferase
LGLRYTLAVGDGVVVRAIADDELVGWVEAMHVAFHSTRSAAAEAAFLRDVRQQDQSRTLAAVDSGRIAGTFFSFPAQLTLPGGSYLTVDAISAVSVLPTYRRRGLLTRMVQTDLRAARERGEAASILIPAEFPIYGRFGFGPATEQALYTLERATVRFTRTAAGSVDLVEPAQLLEVAPGLFDQFRRQHVGQIDRSPIRWQTHLGVSEAPWNKNEPGPRCVLFTDPAGEPRGYLLYQVEGIWTGHAPAGKLDITELVALTPDAYLGLWRYACEVDLIAELTADRRRTAEPLAWLLDNARAAMRQTLRTDFLWLRPLEVPATLGARRYFTEQRLVLEVTDPLDLCGGRFVLEGGPAGATCRPSQASADLQMSMTALGAITLGGVSLHLLAEAGAIAELTPGALDTAERLFRWPGVPWCSTFF